MPLLQSLQFSVDFSDLVPTFRSILSNAKRSSLGLVCGGSGTEADIVLLLHLDVYRAIMLSACMYNPVQRKVCRIPRGLNGHCLFCFKIVGLRKIFWVCSVGQCKVPTLYAMCNVLSSLHLPLLVSPSLHPLHLSTLFCAYAHVLCNCLETLSSSHIACILIAYQNA